MTDTMCTYPRRDDLLIAYVYDEVDAADRLAFDAHVAACGACQFELAQLQDVRAQLTRWQPPQPRLAAFGWRHGGEDSPTSVEPQSTRGWRTIPAWAQVAAALLVLGVSAGIANLDVRYDRNGLSVRTGWSGSAGMPSAAAGASPTAAPWRADLTLLERQLRTEFRAAPVAAPAPAVQHPTPSMSDAELLRRVRALVDDSERRQQRELALRVAEVVRDVNAQRQADLVKIDRNLGLIQSNTVGEAMKQRQLLNYLVRASQKQ